MSNNNKKYTPCIGVYENIIIFSSKEHAIQYLDPNSFEAKHSNHTLTHNEEDNTWQWEMDWI